MLLKASSLLIGIDLWVVLVLAYDQTETIFNANSCGRTIDLDEGKTLGIFYDAASSWLTGTCELTVQSSDSSKIVCVETKAMRHPCGANIRFYLSVMSRPDETYTCKDEIEKWCGLHDYGIIEIEPKPGSGSTAFELSVYISSADEQRSDDDFDRMDMIWIIVGVTVGFFALAVIVPVIICCYCCRRAKRRGHIGRTQQPAAMPMVAPPPQGSYPAQQAPQGSYPGQQAPPQTSYMYPPLGQENAPDDQSFEKA